MGTARNRPRASGQPYFAIHSTKIHFTQCKKTFSRKHKSYTVFRSQIHGQICRKFCFVCFQRAVYTKKFIQKATYDNMFRAFFVTDARCAEAFGRDKSGTPESGINKPAFKCHVVEIKHPLGQFSKKHIIVKQFQQLYSMKTLTFIIFVVIRVPREHSIYVSTC